MYTRSNSQATTFVIGFIGGDATQLTQLADAGSGGKYTYFNAQNEQALINAITSAIQLAQAESLSFETPVITSESSASENAIYQSTFTYLPYKQWEGTLVKKNYVNGVIGSTIWDASTLLNNRTAGSRKIWTVGPGLSTQTTLNNFTTTYWSSLKNSFNHYLITDQTSTNKLIDFVRGVDTYNQNNRGTTSERWKLADIYHSRIIYVGPPEEDTSSSAIQNTDTYYRSQNNYANFKTQNANREKILLAGSNGGMLHAFRASTGEELWAFIPPSMLPRLPKIISQNVNTGTTSSYQTISIYGVDGSPIVKDIFVNGQWRTIVICGLGRGGQSFFALDITNPNLPIHLFTVENDFVNSKVYFWNSNGQKTEWAHSSITGTNNKNYSRLGETWSNPRIIRVRDSGGDRWVAVFGSGYNGAGGTSAVYVVDLHPNNTTAPGVFEGFLRTKVDIANQNTGIPNSITADLTVITPNSTTLFDSTTYGAMVYALALDGMVYKINLTNKGTFADFNRLFSANSNSTNARYTFNNMEAGISDGNLWLYFGTGDMTKIEDRTNSQLNRLIGFKDPDRPFTSLGYRSLLTVDNNCTNVTSASTCLSISSGWYVNLTNYRKVTAQPTIYGDVIYFPIYEPNIGSSCVVGKAYLTGLDTRCGYPKLSQIVIGDGVLSQVVVSQGNVVVGVSTKKTQTLGGFQQKDNIITGAAIGSSKSIITVKGWREN
jgi:type IV pilus assembly protein PilY1